ncbi:maleylpyruvate isomerase N-terminal domain-containing protein [Cellulomonas algicola]|uniref:maleylpyruvate isomerase N-terminal domain-containing protein n=1 Tax=Cellulomonas algicola TaxID=2071633 RepID=UPI001C3FC736|nr:maleylpyruvate isomerase N-terminal domain-containing protein [Cellulomonas algicola]
MPITLPPLTFAGDLDRSALVPATRLLVDLVARPEVAAAWHDESSCAGMSVGALARHLVVQPLRVVEVLTGQPAAVDAEPFTVDQHYAQAAWIQQDLDGPANVGVRTRSEEEAEVGPEAVAAEAREILGRLDDVLAAAPDVVVLPWTGAALATDDFLVTRFMEIVVHSDDLASSVGLPTPEFDAATLVPVVRLLSDLALRRHGQDALVRTLSRPQRAPGSIAAF